MSHPLFSRKALALVFLFASACGSMKLLAPVQADVDRVAGKFPNYSLAELAEGKTLYEQQCGSCHSLKRPSSETEEGWRRIVPKMTRKTNRQKPNSITPEGQEKILRYLITMMDANR